MKLTLENQKDVTILSVSGEIAEEGAQVIRAGLTKILKTGKNKIVLRLLDKQELSPDALSEIVQFDALARELAGRLVLAGVSPAPKEILRFGKLEEAVAYFSGPETPEEHLAPLGKTGPKKRLLTEQVMELEEANQELKKLLVLSTLARRPPANEPEYLQQIALLESKLEQALETLASKA